MLALACMALLASLLPAGAPRAADAAPAQSYQRISGEGSSWAFNAIDNMRVNVRQFGITVDYNPSGSTSGRQNWLRGIVDFAASDIPFQFEPEDGSAPEDPEPGTYAYIPVTAGGTAFMYNLKINGQRVTNLRLSGENVARIFTGAITRWNDPAIAADNPGLRLPARQIVPVVRSDGSGSTHQFTNWMIAQHGGVWRDYCERSGRAPACGATSFYPTVQGMIAQRGDDGVAGYVAQSLAEGAIGYVNYSYALNANFPVAKVLNAAGYYTEPTPENVAVSLLQARINTDESDLTRYLTQDLSRVYTDPDPRNYQLSSYSYFILPANELRGSLTEEKGRTLGAFTYYAMCQAQQQSASLGYSPIPINLVEAAFEQIRLIPGVEVQSINIQDCRNPTFSSDGTNVLAENAPRPQECDRQGRTQCGTGTGGAAEEPTPTPGGSGSAAPSTGNGQPAGGNGDVSGQSPDANGSAGEAGGDGGTRSGRESGSGSASDAASTGEECDPDTGICGSSTGSVTADAAGSGDGTNEVAGQPAAAAQPTVLAADSGWTSTQTLAVLVVLLVVALLTAPAVLWRRLADQEPPR